MSMKHLAFRFREWLVRFKKPRFATGESRKNMHGFTGEVADHMFGAGKSSKIVGFSVAPDTETDRFP